MSASLRERKGKDGGFSPIYRHARGCSDKRAIYVAVLRVNSLCLFI